MSTASDRLVSKGPRLIRKMDRCILFDSLLNQGPSTRPELAHTSGLLQPTVIATLNELVDVRLVVPLGNDTRDTRRPAKLYQVDPAAASVIAVDIDRVQVHVVMVDIAGDEFYRHDVCNVVRSATTLVELISAKVSQAKAKLLLDPGRTYAVIGSPDVFAPKRSMVDYTDQLPGWHHPKLINMLNDELDAQLQVEGDVNLAALTESIHGQVRRHESFAYFHVGTGAGLATILNRKLHRGFYGAAGELAYLLTVMGVNGRARVLEDVVSARALAASARELGLIDPTPKAVLQLVAAGGPTARQVMDRFVEGILVTVIAISAILNPECVVPSGSTGIRLRSYVTEISGAVTRRSPFHVDLEVVTLHIDAMLRGAVDMGLKTARNAMFQLGILDDLG